MMNLNKRYKRGIVKNLSFYICLFFLTGVTILMFLLFATSVNGENEYVNEFFHENNIEDGQFQTLIPISDDEIETLCNDYKVQLERQRYIDMENEKEDYTVRIFEHTSKVNKSEIIRGKEAEKSDEICLSTSFAEANGLEIDDKIKLNNNEYRIVGFCERPDYLFMIQNQMDSYSRASKFGIALVSQEDFDKFENTNEYYSVVYNEDNMENFRKYVNDEFVTVSYMTAKTNHRITTPRATITQYRIITNLILPILLLLVMAIIAVVLGRKVSSEQKHIGTLTALGYRKREIIMHYSLYAVIPGVAGEMIGILLTYAFVDRMAGKFFFKLEKLPIQYSISNVNVAIALLLPIALYMLTSVVTVLKILKISIVDMLSGNHSKKKSGGAFVESKMKFDKKYRIRALFNNLGRTVVVILGILISGLIMALSLMMNDSCINYSDHVIDEMGKFNYEYYFTEFQTGEVDDGEEMLSMTFEVEDSENSIILFGTSDDNPYLNFTTVDGNKADLKKGYYISSMASVIFNVKKGDSLEIYDTCSLEKYKIEVEGIIENKAQSVLYTSRENVGELLDIDSESYNLVMSEKKLDLNEQLVSLTIEKDGMKDMIQNVISGMKMMIYIMFVFGMVICVIVIYLMVNMIIEENTVTISMLKVLGYHNREINRITVNIYHVLVPIGIILSLVGGWVINTEFFYISTASFQAYIPSYLSVFSALLFILAVVVSYGGSLFLLGRKVKKVNMTESLKDARE